MENTAGLRIASDLEENTGKFVQLYIQDVPVLVIGNHNLFHGQILDMLLTERSIPFRTFRLMDGTEHAEIKGDLYSAVGMGFAGLSKLAPKEIYLYGRSIGYSLRVNKEHLERIKPHLAGFELILE